MLRFSESNPSRFTSTAGIEPRRGLAALRRLYLPPERAEPSATTSKFETVATDDRRKFGPGYFSSTPARHSFGR